MYDEPVKHTDHYYLSDGRRYVNAQGTKETMYVWAGGELLTEFEFDNGALADTKHIIADHIGYPIASIDESGTMTTIESLPFGHTSSTETMLRFPVNGRSKASRRRATSPSSTTGIGGIGRIWGGIRKVILLGLKVDYISSTTWMRTLLDSWTHWDLRGSAWGYLKASMSGLGRFSTGLGGGMMMQSSGTCFGLT